MIDVYICEDNEKQRNYLKSQIENFITFEQLDMQITTVTDKASVILSNCQRSFQLWLIFSGYRSNTPETNGFPLAQNIRKVEPRCFIVFVTSHIELSYYTYQYKVEALDFIVKDNLDTMKNKIHECILNAYEKHTCTSLIMLLSLQLRCRMTDRFLSLMQKSSLLKLPLSHTKSSSMAKTGCWSFQISSTHWKIN